jgi:transcriptional regulator with XRE-family HTH domain
MMRILVMGQDDTGTLENSQGNWFTANMAGRAKEAGPSSVRVAANLRHIRQQRGLSYAELARRLVALGHPILDTGLMKIEKGERRVDVDDLVALALALGITPNRLIMPDVDLPGITTEYMLTPAVKGRPVELWQWAQGERHPGIPVEGAHSWLGEGEHPDLTFALTNRPYLTATAAPDEVTGASAQRLAGDTVKILLTAVLNALAQSADPMWVRRLVELSICLPETMSGDEISEFMARVGNDGDAGHDRL